MRPTSVYVHFPWCLKKCPYCDFASRSIAREQLPHVEYADAVLRELESRAAALAGRRLVSVFFGGGTPSLWEPAELGRVLAGVRGAFEEAAPDVEVTVECNPTSLDRTRAAALRRVGVERLSVGVQSTDDARLRFLGRLHDGRGAVEALVAARAEMDRVSADLMFGMPAQGEAAFRAEVQLLLDLGVDHVSAYALTIEPGTLFGELSRRGRLALAPEDDYAAMYRVAEEVFAARGLGHYEVSNYAAPGQESRHNQHYWRGGAYVGLGAGAVGCLDAGPGRARRWRNEPEPPRYMSGREPVETEALGPQELVREALMLGLRTNEGVDLDEVGERAGVDPRRGREAALRRRAEAGDLLDEGRRLRVPRARWLWLDTIVADLF